MHDLQTIIKLNAPINQRAPAAAKAAAIAQEVRCPVCSLGVEPLDEVEYGAPETPSEVA